MNYLLSDTKVYSCNYAFFYRMRMRLTYAFVFDLSTVSCKIHLICLKTGNQCAGGINTFVCVCDNDGSQFVVRKV